MSKIEVHFFKHSETFRSCSVTPPDRVQLKTVEMYHITQIESEELKKIMECASEDVQRILSLYI